MISSHESNEDRPAIAPGQSRSIWVTVKGKKGCVERIYSPTNEFYHTASGTTPLRDPESDIASPTSIPIHQYFPSEQPNLEESGLT